MTKREHFERWLKSVKPNMPLGYNEQEGYYYHDMVSIVWQAWEASPKTRPTEDSKITKEQLAIKPNPETVVDRLRGVYPGIASPYPVSHLQKEAADEIERLREEVKRLETGSEQDVLLHMIRYEATYNGDMTLAQAYPIIRLNYLAAINKQSTKKEHHD